MPPEWPTFPVLFGGTIAAHQNLISGNGQDGIRVATCPGNSIRENAIYGNGQDGIQAPENCLAAPTITKINIGPPDVVTGTTAPNAHVKFFSDDDDQGQT